MRAVACIAVLAVSCALAGCSVFRGIPAIRVGENSVQGPKDAGKPATLNESKAGESVVIPAGSKVVVTETAAVAATEKEPAKPAVKVTEVVPSEPMKWEKQETKVEANTGTVDTSIAKKRIEAEESRWLLWAAIGCGIGGLIVRSMLPAWPALSNGLLVGAVFAFASWKLAEVPAWIWAAVIGGVLLLVLGYKRAEWDKDGDGIPDFMEPESKKGKDAQQ